MPSPSGDVDFENLRRQMVDRQLRARGISDAALLRVMEKIPREVFVPDKYRADAYNDGPLPIGANQTISQPYIVALMSELLMSALKALRNRQNEHCVQLDAKLLKFGQETAAWDGLTRHPLTQLLLPLALRAFPNH